MRAQERRIVAAATKSAKALDPADPFDLAAETAIFAEAATPFIERTVRLSGAQVYLDYALTGAFDVRSPLVRQFILDRAQRFAQQVNETTYQRLQRSLADGVDAGEGVPALIDRVHQAMDLRVNQSAEAIARTEVGGADNGAALIAAQQSGQVTAKRWLASIDTMTRESHIATHNEVVPLDANFSLGGPAPGQIGIAAEDINCRCVMTFELKAVQ